jgi:hypothetical protein
MEASLRWARWGLSSDCSGSSTVIQGERRQTAAARRFAAVAWAGSFTFPYWNGRHLDDGRRELVRGGTGRYIPHVAAGDERPRGSRQLSVVPRPMLPQGA